MLYLYNLFIFLYQQVIHLAAFFHPKAKLWKEGRKQLFENLKKKKLNEEKLIWVHCASLGEFEQGRPLIEKIKDAYPAYKILLTFYSPSGYEIRKNYPLADDVFYLPTDTARHARRFLDIVQPTLVIFIKYEFWFHFLHQLKQQNIPVLLVSAVFRQNQLFFKSYGGFFRKMLHSFTHIFVQNQESLELLKSISIQSVTLAGDTRIDRVATIAKEAKNFPLLQQFCQQHPILVAGSTWPPDEKILADFILRHRAAHWKLILAPHDLKETHLNQIEQLIKVPCLRYSRANSTNILEATVLLIDNIGMLSALYQYGKIAYIGGGFGSGIHNTLEPIAFGLPVIFGPKYHKFTEAHWLVTHQAGFMIRNKMDFQQIFQQLEQPIFYKNASNIAIHYVQQHQGASEKIMQYLKNIL